MKIGIDFDNTLVNTSDVVNMFMKKHHVTKFNNEEEKKAFYFKYAEDITKNLKLKDNAFEVLKRLSDKHEFYLLTLRGEIYSPNLPKLTLAFIEENKLPIKEIYFNQVAKQKKCLELGIQLFIDDDIQNCLDVSKVGINTLLFDNEHKELKTVKNWLEIEKIMEGYNE